MDKGNKDESTFWKVIGVLGASNAASATAE